MNIKPIVGFIAPPFPQDCPIDITDKIIEGDHKNLEPNEIHYKVLNKNTVQFNLKLGNKFATFELEINP